ncbi:Uncharacterized protein OBRU01_19212, partial [Operophtera brumata]
MKVWKRLAAILVLVLIAVTSGCDVNDVAVYKVSLRMMWSEERFPKDYPEFWPKAQWSRVFVGEVSRASVRDFAQHGVLDELVKQGDEEPKVYDQFSAPAVSSGEGANWFIGVDSLDLCVDSTWLEPLDAGAESGLTFTAPHWENSSPEPVSKHKPRKPDHPAAGFYYPDLRELPAIAKAEFKKIKEYSTIELNNLARKDMVARFRAKDQRKGLPKSRRYFDTGRTFHEENEEITTKNYADNLKDLEEDPVGTPRPNLPDNNVIV